MREERRRRKRIEMKQKNEMGGQDRTGQDRTGQDMSGQDEREKLSDTGMERVVEKKNKR